MTTALSGKMTLGTSPSLVLLLRLQDRLRRAGDDLPVPLQIQEGRLSPVDAVGINAVTDEQPAGAGSYDWPSAVIYVKGNQGVITGVKAKED